MDDDTDGLFDEPDVYEQDGPGLFADDPAPDALPVEPAPPAEPDAGTGRDREAPPAPHRPTPPPAPTAPLALYRRYRPDVFADIIGQEQVTEPLRRALLNNRVNHAYLFSGPRGCGKTSSARILARALNCEQGPTPDPCGVCQSCRDLARGGPGSIDVIEIDAASHGGVDDARDLRERAFFAPVQSRFKIYIVDEAHMVTQAGFNALLKLVEEPPPHVKFIFATTEPEKVIGTIRSRTHHYPFRLVPPKVLGAYLEKVCQQEGVAIQPGVIPLVVRAGAGSVRDSLSVLDQLLGAASDAGVTYRQATGLLGFTPDSLLDEIIDAFAARDAGGVFAAVEKVIDAGQDPRRFTEDLLRRLRDLVIVASVPDAVASGLIDVSGDQGDRLTVQANGLGAGELTRAAEVLADGLVAMRGTTAPRLHLELMCARVLLPGVGTGDQTVHARLDRIERRLNMGGVGPDIPWTDVASVPVPSSASAADPTAGHRDGAPAAHRDAGPDAPRPVPGPDAEAATRQDPPRTMTGQGGRPGADQDVPSRGPGPDGPSRQTGQDAPRGGGGEAGPRGTGGVRDERTTARSAEPQTRPEQARGAQAGAPQGTPGQQSTASGTAAGRRTPTGEPPYWDAPPVPGAPPAPTTSTRAGELSVADIRRLWPDILDAVKHHRRFAWMVLSHNVQVSDLVGGTLWLSFDNAGAMERFRSTGCDLVLAESLVSVLGADLTIATRLEGEPPPGGRQARRTPQQGAPASTPPGGEGTVATPAQAGPVEGSRSGPPAGRTNPSAPTAVASAADPAGRMRSADDRWQGDPGADAAGDYPADEPPEDPWEEPGRGTPAPSGGSTGGPQGPDMARRPDFSPDAGQPDGASTSPGREADPRRRDHGRRGDTSQDPEMSADPGPSPDSSPDLGASPRPGRSAADAIDRSAHPSATPVPSPVAAAARLLRGFDASRAAGGHGATGDPRESWPAEETRGGEWGDSRGPGEASDSGPARRSRHLRVVTADGEPTEPEPDDPIIDDSGVDAEQLLRTVLNAEIISE